MDLVGLSVRTGHFCLHLLMSDRVSKLFCMGFYTVGTCDYSSLFFPHSTEAMGQRQHSEVLAHGEIAGSG